MSRVLMLVEGETEETFIRDVLRRHLEQKAIYLQATIVATRKIPGRPYDKGGIATYQQIRRDLMPLLGDTGAVLVTTMFDFYGLPDDFPGRNTLPPGSCYQRVAYLEAEWAKEVKLRRFLPYLMLHEFEALLFAEPEKIAAEFPDVDEEKRKQLLEIRSQFNSPEEINEGEQTAPSKRLLALLPGYRKTFHGPLVTETIGLDTIRKECQHFREWLEKLEAVSSS